MTSAQTILYKNTFDTPLGSMIAIANESALFLLEFTDSKHLTRSIKRLQKHAQSVIQDGITKPIQSIQKELNLYFKNGQRSFNTQISLIGTAFQKKVWQALLEIPTGETRSYRDIARTIKHPTAYRAVAQANAANLLPIIIPCHRVINSNGALGGYNCGIQRKEWLLAHERD